MENFENNTGWNAGENTQSQQPVDPQQTVYQAGERQEERTEQGFQQPQTAQDGWSYPGGAPHQKKPKKEKRGGRIVAVALICALLGSLGGGAITGVVAGNYYNRQTQALQTQIDALAGQGKESPTIVTSVSAEGLKSGAQIYAENVDAVVSVTSKGTKVTQFGNQSFESRGTGFFISEDGYLLSNHHVIANADSITITANDGTEYEAKLIGSDEYFDVALLKVEAQGLPCVTIGDSDNTAVGEQVVAIGNALGELTSSFTGGYLSGLDRMVSTDGTAINMMQTDAAINSGNSGGPLFNMQGEVIGITSAKYSGSTSSGASIEGIGFAIPINDVMELVGDLRDYGYVKGQAYLGVMISNVAVDPQVAEAYGLPTGPQVQSVDEGGAAEKAGIQPKDIITAIGDDEITSVSDLQVALRQRRAGETDTITVFRSGQILELTITFDEKPAENTGTTEPTEAIPEDPGQFDSWEDMYEFFNRYFGN